MSRPYTHADHARKCVVAAYRGESLALRVQFVQVRMHGAVCCARIVDAWDTADGVEMWKLDIKAPINARMSAPARNVRQCQGVDGCCSCVPVDDVSLATGDGKRSAATVASDLPDGNHGEYLSETAE